ncbi:MAG: HDOD domain-containing protein [Bermanella sp.]
MNLASLFEQTHNLPNIPKVVQELIETFNQEDFDMDEIAHKISLDPVLTAKVLRLANSAHYGVSRSVASTADATVLLGFSTLRTLVLASGITGAMQAPEGFDRKEFWRDNFAVAAISKWMASYCDVNAETAFTCGMLHSIGELLIQLLMPSEAKKVAAAVHAGGKIAEVELAMLGYNYADVGAELASRWKFPSDIVEGIRHHAAPLVADEVDDLAALVNLATYMHDSHKQGWGEKEILKNFPLDVAKAINMDTQQALEYLQQLDGIESGMDSLLEGI